MNALQQVALWASLMAVMTSTAWAEVVKKSATSICHPPESRWYERTQSYTAYDSIEACLASGGRLPQELSHLGASRSVPKAPETQSAIPKYNRALFGQGWSDTDGDCQNSRAEVLIATSTTPVVFADPRRCQVVAGRWISPYTGQVIQNSSEIDIDHIVPLSWAWTHGAHDWSREKREQFANDPVNLWPVEASLNRSKGNKAPDQWLPPSGRCQYVARFVRIVRLYDLKPSETTRAALDGLLAECRSRGAVVSE